MISATVLLIVASDRISTYDVVPPDPDPGQGQRPHGALDVLVRAHLRDRPEPPLSVDRRRAGRGPGSCDGGAQARMLPVECVVRGYLSGSRVEGLPADRAVSGIELPAGPARVRPAARADLHAVHEGRRRARRGDRLRGRGRVWSATGRWPRRRATFDRRLSSTPPNTPARAGSSSPTRSSSSVSTPTAADAWRRGLHSRLVALLAGRRVRTGPRPAELRQAVRARLGLVDRLGPASRRRRRSRTTSSRARGRSTSRHTSGSSAIRSTSGFAAPARHEGARSRQTQGGDPRPAGSGRRAGAPGAGLPRRETRPRRAAGRARGRGP